MSTLTAGLHQRPTYHSLIQEIQHGEKIKLPNRDAIFLRNSPYMAFLDGQGTTEMQEQQERVQKQAEVEHVVREQSAKGNSSVSEIRVKNQINNASTQVEKMLTSSGNQTDPVAEDMDDVTTSGQQPPQPPAGPAQTILPQKKGRQAPQ